MIGKTLGGATVATIQGLLVLVICLIAGFRPVSWASLPFALVFMILTAIVFSGLGVAIGSVLQDIQGMQLIMNFLVLPIFFLSGALFPLNDLPSVLSFVTRIDPLSYGIDGLRSVMIGTSQFNPAVSLVVLCGLALLFLGLGSYSFSKIQL
ncbi:MAG TPA: ABC transporter permease, partial [Pyrinomonadaceae bacterium]|jgi:ABC-2 type transport system permease protein|nr:ABC transporter permease [Pyrinomonadaceae bacterium]